MSRLPQWRFDIQTLDLSVSRTVQHQATALRNTLQDLTSMQTSPNCIVWLVDWQWTAELLHVLRDGLPQLQHLRFGIRNTDITTQLLDGWAQLPSNCRHLRAPGIKLNTHQHVNTPWPWEELFVGVTDMTGVVNMPHPTSARGGCPTILFNHLDFTRVREVSTAKQT